jgi:hypothetical protein
MAKLSRADILRIAAESSHDPRTVVKACKGEGTTLSRARIEAAAARLGIALPGAPAPVVAVPVAIASTPASSPPPKPTKPAKATANTARVTYLNDRSRRT